MANELISLFGEGLIVAFGIWGVFLTGLFLFWFVLFCYGLSAASKELNNES